MISLFSQEEIDKMFAFAKGKSNKELTHFVNTELNRPEIKDRQIRNFVNRNKKLRNLMRTNNLFTPDQISWITENCDGKTNRELMETVNNKFDLRITLDQMITWTKRRPEIRKRMIKWNTRENPLLDLTDLHNACRKPIGHTRPDKKSGWMTKVREDQRGYERLSKIVWENAHGYIGDSKVICSLDGDITNVSLDNLFPATKAALAYLASQKQWVYDDPELMKSRILRAEIVTMIQKRKKEG